MLEPPERGSKVTDDAVVVAGDLAGVRILQHPAMRCTQFTRGLHDRDRRASATRNVAPSFLLGILLEQLQESIGIERTHVLLNAIVEGCGTRRVEIMREVGAGDEQRPLSSSAS